MLLSMKIMSMKGINTKLMGNNSKEIIIAMRVEGIKTIIKFNLTLNLIILIIMTLTFVLKEEIRVLMTIMVEKINSVMTTRVMNDCSLIIYNDLLFIRWENINRNNSILKNLKSRSRRAIMPNHFLNWSHFHLFISSIHFLTNWSYLYSPQSLLCDVLETSFWVHFEHLP